MFYFIQTHQRVFDLVELEQTPAEPKRRDISITLPVRLCGFVINTNVSAHQFTFHPKGGVNVSIHAVSATSGHAQCCTFQSFAIALCVKREQKDRLVCRHGWMPRDLGQVRGAWSYLCWQYSTPLAYSQRFLNVHPVVHLGLFS